MRRKKKKDETFYLCHNLQQNMLKTKLQMSCVVKGLLIAMAGNFLCRRSTSPHNLMSLSAP